MSLSKRKITSAPRCRSTSLNDKWPLTQLRKVEPCSRRRRYAGARGERRVGGGVLQASCRVGPWPSFCIFLRAELGGGGVPGQTEIGPGLTRNNVYENEHPGVDNKHAKRKYISKHIGRKSDVWKIRLLHVLQLKKCSQNLFGYLAVLGENCNSFQFKGNYIKGTRLVNAQRAGPGRICNMLIHDGVISKPPPWQDWGNETSCCQSSEEVLIR